jgi:hypothetical protein
MTMPHIRHEVEMMLAEVEQQIAEAEERHARGGRPAVAAVGELTFLRRQKAAVDARLQEIDRDPNAHETLLQWIREEAFNLKFRLAGMVEHL